MARRKQQAATAAETPWKDAEQDFAPLVEVPDENAEVNRKQRKWRKRFRILTWTSLIMLPVLLLVNLVLASTLLEDSSVDDDGSSASGALFSAGKAAAYAEIQEWIGTSPQPVPGASVLSWDGFETISQDKSVSTQVLQSWGDRDYDVELHKFTLATTSGQDYEATVTVAVDEYGQSEVIGTPSALPIAPSSTGWSTEGAWMNVVDTTATDAMDEAVTNWAEAYTSGDSAKLRLAVGDQDSSHTYMALSGVSSVTASITSAGYTAEIDGTQLKTQEHPSQVIAEISLQIVWNGQDAKVVDATGTTQTLDVLIVDANTASPRVVAWGASGTGPELEAGDNAITGRKITSSTGSSPTPSTSSSPTSSTSTTGE